ncbi:MAG: phosphatase PAP2 family protein [Rhizobiaceae bacterium]
MDDTATLRTAFAAFASRTVALMRADAWLYGAVLAYTCAGLFFLAAVDATEQAAYGIYVGRWLLLFGFLAPAVVLLAETGYLLHRFERRRRLAARRMFSTRRLAHLGAGIALLCGMVLFQGTFTSVKNALPLWRGGFPYDEAQANIDRWLHFGVDPWRWLYEIGAHDWLRVAVEWNYNMLWFVVCFGALFVVATTPRLHGIRARYLVGFMLVWVLAGNVLAGAFMSAGPAFYGHVTGDPARFAGQMAFLARGDWANSAAAYQDYLWNLHAHGLTGFGSGISAFPSVHVGLIMLNALFVFDWNRRLGLIAFAYVGLVVASSVYLAWHYAIDGYASIVLVTALFYALKRWMPRGAAAPAAAEPVPARRPLTAV